MVREALKARGMSVCHPGSCWAPGLALGKELDLRCHSGDPAEGHLPRWLGCTGTGQ